MTNIEIRSEMKNEAGETTDSTYTGYFMNPSTPLEDRLFIKRDFYFNLDTVSSFYFGKVEKDLKVRIENNETGFTEKEVVLKKETPFIEFFMIVNGEEVPYIMLTFLHEGEYQRTQRILTDKLCVK